MRCRDDTLCESKTSVFCGTDRMPPWKTRGWLSSLPLNGQSPFEALWLKVSSAKLAEPSAMSRTLRLVRVLDRCILLVRSQAAIHHAN